MKLRALVLSLFLVSCGDPETSEEPQLCPSEGTAEYDSLASHVDPSKSSTATNQSLNLSSDPVEASTQMGIAFILTDVKRFNRSCASCHVSMQAVRASSFALARPELIPDAAAFSQAGGHGLNFETQTRNTINRLYAQQYDGSGFCNGAVTHVGNNNGCASYGKTTTAWAAYGLSEMPSDSPDFDQDRFLRMASYLARIQHANGAVTADHVHYPVDAGHIMATSQAMSTWARANELSPGAYSSAISKGLSYLRNIAPRSHSRIYIQEISWIILGLRAGGVPADDPQIVSLVNTLKSFSNADGGWSNYSRVGYKHPHSDAFATGIALCGLNAAGETNSDAFPEFRDGVTRLVNTQAHRGYWNRGGGEQSLVSATIWPTVCLAQYQASNAAPVAVASVSNEVNECVAGGAEIALFGDQSYDPDGDPLSFLWSNQSSDANFSAFFPLGSHTQTLVVNDGSVDSDPATVSFSVVDTTPPVILADQYKEKLWPPNHSMHLVGSFSVTDLCCNASLSVNVVSNEPINQIGDGDTDSDWYTEEVDGVVNVYLRAERAGGKIGRTYTVTASSSDCAGNSASVSFEVLVDHDQRNSKGKKK